jgi:hypothetical protein
MTTGTPLPGVPVLNLGELDLASLGYVVEEHLLEGEAASYRLDAVPSPNGRWDARPVDRRPFRTRIVVVRPQRPEAFSGTAVVEWLNVSGGADVAVGWIYAHRHLLRTGAVWVGVSAQRGGIDGGGFTSNAAVTPLRTADPERYASLAHPGDAYAFDVFSAAVRAVRAPDGPLGGLRPDVVLASGSSQSASFLVTYLNAVDPLAQVVDGALLHGRGAQGPWLDGVLWDPRRMVREAAARRRPVSGHRIRADVRVPVHVLQAETDLVVLGSVFARQPDSSSYRLWEVAGAAHFDSYGLAAGHRDDGTLSAQELHDALRPVRDPFGVRTSAPVNSGPQLHYAMQAALDGLARWARGDGEPPVADRVRTKPLRPMVPARDSLHIATGGVRSPWVDAPTSTLSGTGQRVAGFGLLFGSTRPLAGPVLAARYPGGREQYEEEFAAAAADMTAAGHLSAADLREVTALGQVSWPTPRRVLAAVGAKPRA